MTAQSNHKFSPAALLDNLPKESDAKRLVVGYSGGLDSRVLLHALSFLRDTQRIAIPLQALHIHHGVNPKADQWAAHCAEVCDRLAVPYHCRQITAESSSENALREARYQAFAAYLERNDLLLLAHHADDQAETLLYRLLRGAGLAGMSGMPVRRDIGPASLIRPLLGFSREQLARYAAEQALDPIDDESNSDTGYDRNYIRHEVIPLLRARWPAYRRAVTRNADITGQANQALTYFCKRELDRLAPKRDCIPLEALNGYPRPVQSSLLRQWLKQHPLPVPDFQVFQRIYSEVVDAVEDASPRLAWPGGEIRRFRNCLYAMKPLAAHDSSRQFPVKVGRNELNSAGTLVVRQRESVANSGTEIAGLTIRFRRGGERCRPAGRSGSRLLKKLLQEYSVLPWLRDRVPLIYCGEELVAVADLWVCEVSAPPAVLSHLEFIWEPPG